MSAPAPLCFVLMPFNKKTDAAGLTIDFDAVYRDVIRPAVIAAGLDPLRADEEMSGGIIHKPMFERLVLCDFAVADLTTANANVFYELGVRHAVRPASTVLMFAEGGRLPFDVAPLRAIPYRLTSSGLPADPQGSCEALRLRLAEARSNALREQKPLADSPLYQLLQDYPNVQHEKTDVFREQVHIAREQKEKLANARRAGRDAVVAFESELGSLEGIESGVLIDLFLSYRAVKAWDRMVALVSRMPRVLAVTVLVQEQLALALNRLGRDNEAESVLRQVLASRGPSSETYGILGRVYKDRWEKAQKSRQTIVANALLDQAIEVYLKGFEADWRDAYPGVNAVTMMELREPRDSRQAELIPIVTYAVKRRIASGTPDYWDYASLLELAVLAGDDQHAVEALGKALVHQREVWEPETALRNLQLIADARSRRGEAVSQGLASVLDGLRSAAATAS